MRNAVVWSVKSCEGHVIGKKGSAELVGYDFMVDEQLNPWLIEVNMSPSMDYSTPVTKKLVKMVLQDTAKLLSSPKKGNQVGGFTCIYRGNDDLPRYNLYNI
jgi:tubulin monoglycylase TTLL3/8